ncbi:MAG: glycosyltransferase family 4 protein [Spirochaetales bacterium]
MHQSRGNDRLQGGPVTRHFTLLVAGSPDQRTGGYLYDAQIVAHLREQNWEVDVIGLEGRFPDADERARAALEEALSRLPEQSDVVVDGLAMGALPELIERYSDKRRITALVHHPLCDERGLEVHDQERLHRLEIRALAAVGQIIVTSAFTRRRLNTLSKALGVSLPPVHVVEPGVKQPVAVTQRASNAEVNLLCIGTLTPRKGQDLLVEALARLTHLDWRCICYGSRIRNSDFAARVSALIEERGLDDRVILGGECDDTQLEAAYHQADVLVLPSWYEGYGMVVTEAIAHGVPVITTTGGALADTLPQRAGIAVSPGDIDALSQALERVIVDSDLRRQLQRGADDARRRLPGWREAARAFGQALQAPAGAHFEAGWLALREPVDREARSLRLTGLASKWLQSRSSKPHLVDLGSGRGSNFCFLAPHLPGPQRWSLIDHDAKLLNQAYERGNSVHDADGRALSVATECVSLSQLVERWPADAHLITASALIDLVSREWIEKLVARCAAHHQALLIALSVTGDWRITDCEGNDRQGPEDTYIHTLFVAHQQRDKGLGAALGGGAHDALAAALRKAGFTLDEDDTPWRLRADINTHYPLLMQLLQGWAEAAREQSPEAGERIEAWCRRRLSDVETKQLGAWIGHRDLFATPPSALTDEK